MEIKYSWEIYNDLSRMEFLEEENPKEYALIKWVAVDEEIKDLELVQEIIASADDIKIGEEYAELQKMITKHIKKLKGEQ